MSLTIHSVDAMELIEDDNITGASDDDDDDNPSSPGSAYDDGNLINVAMENEVTAQLVAAGVVGVAAAAAITSSKKKKRPHSFETNPSIRKRQQNRLLRKLRQTIFEYATRVGQQAVVLVATPGKPNNIYKVFGAKPLEDVLKNLRNNVMDKLDEALAAQAPPRVQDDPSLFELPPLIIDGIPTPVEKMTQAQLRAFIPLMLKYSTGRGKPGWGRDSTRPPWWPKELPWANVRMDARSEDEKQKISWTHALRKIVINCYKYHGREDLLPAFSEEDEKANAIATASSNVDVMKIENGSVVSVGPATNLNTATATITNGTGGQQQIIIHQQHPSQTSTGTATITTGANGHTQIIKEDADGNLQIQQQPSPTQTLNAQVCLDSMALSDVDFTHTVLQTIQNADGTVSIIQVDPNNPIITLPDGTTAQVQGIATLQQQGDGGVHTIQTISDGQGESMSVDLTEATLGQDGQLIITGEDGQGFPVNVSGMITVPMSAQMYQTMVANIQQVPNVDGTVCITPMQVSNLASNANQQTTPTSTHNLTIATNGAHQSTHHQQQQQQAIAMMANYSLGSNVGPGAVLNLPQLTAHHLSQAVGQNKHHHAQRNNSIRAGNTSSPVVGFNTAQRVCLNVSTPSANNQHASANLSTGVLSLNRKSNLGDGSEGSIEVCIPKIEPMDEDKDGTTDGSAGVTQNFVIQLNGQSFTVNDGKSLQHQHLKRSIEHSVNDGSHLIDALTISAKHVAGSSASEIDTKHFAIPSV
ncbi:DNA-binding protein Ewg-like isoform X1 [Anopheles albimanus]|uniref:Nuclear respiratory factor 1 NLS/DNA-binding dimerisation domain-containing protein n=1 Tax=Anopheles albimanus TaxID=7167 RepID=A0A182G080_ANOAL|nr:DNA-binding protein Ewg-like isoform X1 [Anopheles albimanus]XP_035783876.1 DNA-binding protein Ewg-like isoform X1 [Anopheles albimanus]XP_035783877.1 DNA-binding protein Ewg-like isoform X1 [Anopheles albimanus]